MLTKYHNIHIQQYVMKVMKSRTILEICNEHENAANMQTIGQHPWMHLMKYYQPEMLVLSLSSLMLPNLPSMSRIHHLHSGHVEMFAM